MANVITIQQAGTTIVNTPVEANYIVIDGTLEVAAGGVITGDPFAPGMGATVEVRGGTLISTEERSRRIRRPIRRFARRCWSRAARSSSTTAR
jgi:hypothetical protein